MYKTFEDAKKAIEKVRKVKPNYSAVIMERDGHYKTVNDINEFFMSEKYGWKNAPEYMTI